MTYTDLPEDVSSHYAQCDELDLKLHYLESGSEQESEEVILLVHGWPTSSYLYRNMMPQLAEFGRVIAIDLPGYGWSDKPSKASYSFRYHARAINSLLDHVGAKKVHLVVHDLGGPIGLWWASQYSDKVLSYVLLDTIIDSDFSWAVKLFVGITLLPGLKHWISSPSGIRFSMRFGLHLSDCLSDESLKNYQAPFMPKQDRIALRRSASTLHMDGFKAIESYMDQLDKPLCIIYADDDRILPDVEEKFTQLKMKHPDAVLHVIKDAGHFLQEEKPREVAETMASFYSEL